MGYLEELHRRQQEPGLAGGLAMGIGALAGGLGQFQQGQEDRATKLADRMRELSQQMHAAGDVEGALAMAHRTDKAYGRVGPKLSGTWEDAPPPTPGPLSSMAPGGLGASVGTPDAAPFGVAPGLGLSAAALPSSLSAAGPGARRYNPDRPDFSNPANQEAVRKYVGAPAPKVEYKHWDPTDAMYKFTEGKEPELVRAGVPKAGATGKPVQDPVTGKWFVPTPGQVTNTRPAHEGAGRMVQNPTTGEWFTPAPGMVTPVPPKMQAVTLGDGSVVMVPTTPAAPGAQPKLIKPPPRPKPLTEDELEQEARAALPNPKGDSKRVPNVLLVKRRKFKDEARAKRAAEDAAWVKSYGGGGGNPSTPGGGATLPAGNLKRVSRASQSAISPPEKYEDVALLPEMEAHAKSALALAPGTRISSRARSKDRNTNAGGVDDSWHMHRQAFDLVGAKPAQKAALKAWANQAGLWMYDEGDHLHFHPLQGVSAETAPKMLAFYDRHGITPGEA